MVSFVDELSVLAGVVVGALASYATGAAAERTRWRRQQSTRWDERRAQAYADYGYAVKSVYMQCVRMVEDREPAAGNEPHPAEELAELRRLADERTSKWESVLLLGNPDTVTAARKWHRLIWRMEPFAEGQQPEAREWETLRKDVAVARKGFYEAARRDLGITSGALPDAPPWEDSTTRHGLSDRTGEVSADAN